MAKLEFDPLKSARNARERGLLCFVRIPDGIRVISLRRANAREAARHEQAKGVDE